MAKTDTLRRAELRLAKKQARHTQTLDYLDRGLALVQPIITSPVTMLLGSYVAIEAYEVWMRKKIAEPGGMGFWDDVGLSLEVGALRTAIIAGFTANAFGGPAGIAKIITAVK